MKRRALLAVSMALGVIGLAAPVAADDHEGEAARRDEQLVERGTPQRLPHHQAGQLVRGGGALGAGRAPARIAVY